MTKHEAAINGLEATIKKQQQSKAMLKHIFGSDLAELATQLQHYGDYTEADIVADIEQRLNSLLLSSEITIASRTIANYEATVSAI